MKDKSTDDIDLAELDELNKAYAAIREQMSRQIVGQNDVLDQLLIAVFAAATASWKAFRGWPRR